MPYKIKKVKGGEKVVSKDTGKTHSDKSLSHAQAVAQLTALYANVLGAKKK